MEEEQKQESGESHKEHHEEIPKKRFSLKEFYIKEYKKLLIIPFLILFLALGQIAFQYTTTGDFISKGVSLKGGITVTVPFESKVNVGAMEDFLSSEFKNNDVSVRSLSQAGNYRGVIIDIDIDISDTAQVDAVIVKIGEGLKTRMNKGDYTVEGIGSSLGESFFKEAFIAIIIAFVFMGLVVFIYFRAWAPSTAVILAAFSDMVITVAVVNIIGIKVGTAGIAAFLMLIGYSVDTDILLSTRILKRKEGSFEEKLFGAMKTGLTMTATTIIAVIVALIATQSDVIRQIMTIVIIGLLIDIINTWIQNVGILRLYLDKKNEPKD